MNRRGKEQEGAEILLFCIKNFCNDLKPTGEEGGSYLSSERERLSSDDSIRSGV